MTGHQARPQVYKGDAMPVMRQVAMLSASNGAFTRSLTDLAVTRGDGGGLTLLGLTGPGGGLSAFRVAATGQAGAQRDLVAHAPTSALAEPELLLLPGGETSGSVWGVGLSGGLSRGQTWAGDGTLSPGAASTAGLPADLLTGAHGIVGGQDFVVGGRNTGPVLGSYQQTATGFALRDTTTLTFAVNPMARIDDVEVISVGGVSYALAVSGLGDFLSCHAIGADGSFDVGQVLRMGSGAPFANPQAVEAVTVAGATYAIVAGAGSGSLTSLRVAVGGMSMADHVLDELGTRFGGARELEAVNVSGRSFLFAAGSDDGISMFTVLPDGTLVHLDSIEDSSGTALGNVSGLAAGSIGGRIALFAASQSEAGISQFEVDPGPIGLTGWAGAGVFAGTGANDMLMAQDATTRIEGGAGDDILAGGSRAVTLAGGAGSDLFIPGTALGTTVIADFDPAHDRIDLGNLDFIRSTAQLTITATATGLVIGYGSSRIDVRSHDGTTLSPSLITDAMFPVAHYGVPGGTVTMIGTEDADLINGMISAVAGYGLGGNDTMLGSYLNDSLSGGNDHDRISGRGGNDWLHGGAGVDVLWGDTGADSMTGAEGNDTLYGGVGDDRVAGGSDHDLADGGEGDDNMTGELGNDRLIGGLGHDTLLGGEGNDSSYGGDGDDLLYEAAGLNFLYGGTGHDTLSGGAEADRMYGEDGDDLLQGRNGNDTMLGLLGSDTIMAGEHNDYLSGGLSNDSLLGENGNDYLVGDDGNDFLNGGYGYDTLYGGTGDDFLFAGGENDRVYGGDGNDRLYGSLGNDSLFGEGGNDYMRGDYGGNVMNGGAGNDSLYGAEGADYMLGDTGNDWMAGLAGADSLAGGIGFDTLVGDAGNDRLIGNEHDDLLMGMADRDELRGDAGRDRLVGGTGVDTLVGGADADLFAFARGDAGVGANADIIVDLVRGWDRIDLRGMGATFIGGGAFTGRPGQLRVATTSEGCAVSIDLNGDRVADFGLRVLHVPTLTATDFLW